MPDVDDRVRDSDSARTRRARPLPVHQSGYMLVDILGDRVLLGEHFDASLGDIADYLVAEQADPTSRR